MDIKEFLKVFFKENPCKKLISYQGSSYKISISASAEGIVSLDLKEISKQVQEITPATSHAKILDDYQYLLCKEIENSVDDPEYIKVLRRFRVIVLSYIARLAEILEQIKNDFNNTELKKELVKFSTRMSGIIYKLEKALLP